SGGRRPQRPRMAPRPHVAPPHPRGHRPRPGGGGRLQRGLRLQPGRPQPPTTRLPSGQRPRRRHPGPAPELAVPQPAGTGTLGVMDHVLWESRPTLRRPVLLAAFEGWNDAGDAASSAVRYLRDRWQAQQFATIDPEDFFDFSSTRPHVRLDDDLGREIAWPSNELSAASLPGTSRDVIVLLGTEPQLKWRTFTEELVGVATSLGVELVVTMGALLADVAHTR